MRLRKTFYYTFMLSVIVCIGISVGITFAQENALEGGTLHGKITDTTSAQNPIEDVEVKIVGADDTTFTTTTDANGDYKKAGIPAGRYLISIFKDGYGERRGKLVTIVDKGDHFVPLKMSKMDALQVEVIDMATAPKPKAPLVEHSIVEPPFGEIGAVIKVRIESLFQRVTESVGSRYNLDEAVVKALHESILDAIDTVLLGTNRRNAFAKVMGNSNAVLLKVSLSPWAFKAAFTEHLSEAQFQDFLEFVVARLQRDQQAAAHQITALLDQELSLTLAQREKVVRLLRDEIEKGTPVNAMRVLRISSPQAAAQLIHDRLKIRMEGIFSQAQSKIWLGLLAADLQAADGGTVRGRITDTTPAQEPIEGVEVKIVGADGTTFTTTTDANGDYKKAGIPAGRYLISIFKDGYGERLGKPVTIVNGGDHYVPLKMLKTRRALANIFDLFVPNRTPEKKDTADTAEPPDARQFVAAKLQAHTELLGTLDEQSAQRLAIVAKGVVQLHFEEQDKRHEERLQTFEANFMEKIETGEMTREQALRSLEMMKKGLSDKNVINISDITRHPLYQQAIKDVLSEEAYAQYSAHQVERRTWRRQALWDLVVTCVDTELLLDSAQRKHLEAAVEVFAPVSRQKSPPISRFFLLFERQRNFEILTPWQQDKFKRVFSPMALERK